MYSRAGYACTIKKHNYVYTQLDIIKNIRNV